MSPTDYKNIRVLGFDLDQTLYPKSPEIDSAIQGYLYQEIAKLRKVSQGEAQKLFDDLYQKGRGFSGRKALIKLGFPEERAHDLVQEALENAPIAEFLRPNKEVLQLLHKLKAKYQNLDLITGSNRNNASIKLEKLGIPQTIFSQIITADDGSKSDFSAFSLWFNRYPTLTPENFLYVGDRVSSDYEKPRELGIRSILVNIKTPDPSVDCPQLPSLFELKNFI